MKQKWLEIKGRINKANGQINFALPKKKVNQKIIDKVYSNKSIKLLFEENE